jgi:hypothetical protein
MQNGAKMKFFDILIHEILTVTALKYKMSVLVIRGSYYIGKK